MRHHRRTPEPRASLATGRNPDHRNRSKPAEMATANDEASGATGAEVIQRTVGKPRELGLTAVNTSATVAGLDYGDLTCDPTDHGSVRRYPPTH